MLAIAIRNVKLSDTSLVVTWFTQPEGKLRTAARGARRPKSPMAGRVDLFCLADISVVRSRHGDLHTLREVALLESHDRLCGSYLSMRLAAYFASLVDLTTELEHPAPELFELLRKALAHLTESPPTHRILERFELRLVTALGIHDGKSPMMSLQQLLNRIPRERAPLMRDLNAATPTA